MQFWLNPVVFIQYAVLTEPGSVYTICSHKYIYIYIYDCILYNYQLWTFYSVNMLYMDLLWLYWPRSSSEVNIILTGPYITYWQSKKSLIFIYHIFSGKYSSFEYLKKCQMPTLYHNPTLCRTPTLYTLLFKYMIKCIKHGKIRIICHITLDQYHPSGLKTLWMIRHMLRILPCIILYITYVFQYYYLNIKTLKFFNFLKILKFWTLKFLFFCYFKILKGKRGPERTISGSKFSNIASIYVKIET
jgi:hypothetical protein